MKHLLSQLALVLTLSGPLQAQEWRYERAPTPAAQQRLNAEARLLPLMPRLRVASMPHPNFTPPGYVLVYRPAPVGPAATQPAVRAAARYVRPSQDDTNPFDYLFADEPEMLAKIKAIRRSGALD